MLHSGSASGASAGEIRVGSTLQQYPQRIANLIPMAWQNGHSRYSGSGPKFNKFTSSFQLSFSRSVDPKDSPVLTLDSLEISSSTALTTERRSERASSGSVDCWVFMRHPPVLAYPLQACSLAMLRRHPARSLPWKW